VHLGHRLCRRAQISVFGRAERGAVEEWSPLALERSLRFGTEGAQCDSKPAATTPDDVWAVLRKRCHA